MSVDKLSELLAGTDSFETHRLGRKGGGSKGAAAAEQRSCSSYFDLKLWECEFAHR